MRLAGEYGDPFTLAIGLQVHAPTGNRDAFAGDGAVRVMPRADDRRRRRRVRVQPALSAFSYRGQDDGFGEVPTGSELAFVATAGVRVVDGMLLLGPELWGTTASAKTPRSRRRPRRSSCCSART